MICEYVSQNFVDARRYRARRRVKNIIRYHCNQQKNRWSKCYMCPAKAQLKLKYSNRSRDLCKTCALLYEMHQMDAYSNAVCYGCGYSSGHLKYFVDHHKCRIPEHTGYQDFKALYPTFFVKYASSSLPRFDPGVLRLLRATPEERSFCRAPFAKTQSQKV